VSVPFREGEDGSQRTAPEAARLFNGACKNLKLALNQTPER
jgi:hypothetical protein